MRKILSILFAVALVLPCFSQTLQKGPTIVKGPTVSKFTAGGGGNVPVFVHKCPNTGIVGGNNTGTTVAIVCANNTTAGNALIVFGAADVTSDTLSISDTAGNTSNYVKIFASSSVATNISANIWVVCSGAGGADTITITGNTSAVDNYGGAIEVSGPLAGTCTDQSSAFTSGLTSGSITNTVANAIFVAALAGGSGGTGPTAPAGWTGIGSTSSGGNNPGWAYLIVSSTGAQSATFTAATGTVFTAIADFQ